MDDDQANIDVADVAPRLLTAAVKKGQAVVRCNSRIPVAELREEVRRLAREQGVRIRSGMLDDVLAVVTTDAALWSDSTATMRSKLAAPDKVGMVA